GVTAPTQVAAGIVAPAIVIPAVDETEPSVSATWRAPRNARTVVATVATTALVLVYSTRVLPWLLEAVREGPNDLLGSGARQALEQGVSHRTSIHIDIHRGSLVGHRLGEGATRHIQRPLPDSPRLSSTAAVLDLRLQDA